MDQAPDQQRIHGVKYRKVTRYRLETTVIAGIPSTREEPYDDWEPVPPREWDDLILRGVTGVAIFFTAVAVVATTASLGGLLDPLVPYPVAYGMGSVFTIAWLYCLGIEWLNRTAPDRAKPAKLAGWFFLLLSMVAVVSYGHTLDQMWAGGFGACIDMVAKGSWWLLLREYAVPLDAGVAHWVNDQEQKLAGRALLAGRMARLNRRDAYQRAVGGAGYQAATAILSSTEAARQGLPAASDEPAPEPVPAPVVPAAPVAPPVVPAAGPVPPAADQDDTEQQAPFPHVAEISRPAIAAICRKEIADDADVTDAALVTAVLAAGHPDTTKLADTVRRSAQRIDPTRKARKIS